MPPNLIAPDCVCDPNAANDPDCPSGNDNNGGGLVMSDGVCVPGDPYDPDCAGNDDLPVISDGVCDPNLAGDPDCGVMPDGMCDLTVPNDPDCAAPTEAPSVEATLLAPDSVNAGDVYTLEWSTNYAACVYLDGQLVDPQGSKTIVAPDVTSETTQTYTLTAYGGDCNNPTSQASVTRIVTIQPLPAPPAP